MFHLFGVAIDLGPIISVLLTIILGILTAATPLIVQRVLAFFKLSGDANARAALESAIQNGIALAQARVNQAKTQGVTFTPEEEKDQVVAGAKAYALPKVPDAIKRLNVTDHLDDVIEARVAAPKSDMTVSLTGTPGGTGTSP